MTVSLALGLVWLIVANLIGMVPSKRKHWPQAYGLIAIGIPILVAVLIENGPIWALLLVAGAASILRWPIVYLGRWLRSIVGSGARDGT